MRSLELSGYKTEQMEKIDFRTPFEKEREAMYIACGERFKQLMTMPHATARRVFEFMAKEAGVTYLTMRRRVIISGAFTPKKKDGNGRTESGA